MRRLCEGCPQSLRNKYPVWLGVLCWLLTLGFEQDAHAWTWPWSPDDGRKAPYVSIREGAIGHGIWGVWTGRSYIYGIERDPQHLWLINAGADPQAAALKHVLAMRGYSLDAITDVLLTDGRLEHTQGLQAFFAHTTIWIGSEDTALARGDSLPRPWGAKVFARRLRMRHFKPTLQPVVPGQCFSIGAHMGRIIALPGYTQGALALVYDDMLFIGQSVQYQAGAFSVANRWFSESPANNRRALQRLQDVDFHTVLTSRDGPIFTATGIVLGPPNKG